MECVKLYICGDLTNDGERDIYVVNENTKVFSCFHEESEEVFCGLKDIIILLNIIGTKHEDYHYSLAYSKKYRDKFIQEDYAEIKL